jgi:biotin synthase
LVPRKIRVSIGTASVLGLLNYRLSVAPTTAYFMSYTDSGCRANCSFCAQSRDYQGDDKLLSRVTWPSYELEQIIGKLKKHSKNTFQRLCIQVINYKGFIEDTINLVQVLKSNSNLPISVDICPIDREVLKKLNEAGAERISIPLDGATPKIFNRVKGSDVNGPYRWNNHLKSLYQALEVFGKGNVGTNLIIGLGETEKQAVKLIQTLFQKNIETILFAFTPIQGTKLDYKQQPNIKSYRRIQIARHLISENLTTYKDFKFNEKGEITGFGVANLYEILKDGKAFQTTGCPGCNRPFYNERPSGPFYNYPRSLEYKEVRKELDELGVIIDE